MIDRAKLQQAAEAQVQVLKHLPQQGDLSLIILKGHLLIEELLFTLVQSSVKHPEAIRSANLTFYNLASIAKALFYDDRSDYLWDAIFTLNALRNALSHNLEPTDLDERLQRFAHAASKGHSEALRLVLSDPSRVMASSIETMCGMLIALIVHPPSEGAT